MSYTRIELIRYHLATAGPVSGSVSDQPMWLAGTDTVRFYDGAVDAESVTVKSRRGRQLTRQRITLAATTVLTGGPVVPDTVVVASDSSLGTVFEENIDYTVDCENGTLSLAGSGALTAGQEVTIWWQPYHVFIAGTDYSLTANRGQIRRLATGDIEPGERVLLDYRPLVAGPEEDLMRQAVREANARVAAEVDTNEEFGADPILEAAATYLALAIVCRSAASTQLARAASDDRVAHAWLKLAETYAAQGEHLLGCFRPPLAGPAAPRRS